MPPRDVSGGRAFSIVPGLRVSSCLPASSAFRVEFCVAWTDRSTRNRRTATDRLCRPLPAYAAPDEPTKAWADTATADPMHNSSSNS
jgi:hypothetical protein